MGNKEFDRCLRCGRKLKNPEARELGYGKICYNKMYTSSIHKKPLFIIGGTDSEASNSTVQRL